MRRNVLIRLLAALVVFLSIGALQTPAIAAPFHGCGDNTLCLFQNQNFGAEMWHSTYGNIYNSSAGGVSHCLNLAPANWSNGTNVEDNTSSAVFNGVDDFPWNRYWIVFFNWVNCNPDGQYSLLDTVHGSMQYMTQFPYYENNAANIYLWHTVTSVEILVKA